VQILGALFGIVVVSYCLAMTAVIARRKGLRAAAATKYAAALGAIVLGALLVLATTSALQRMWAVANECPPYALWKARMYSYYLPYLLGTRLDKLAILGPLPWHSGERAACTCCAPSYLRCCSTASR